MRITLAKHELSYTFISLKFGGFWQMLTRGMGIANVQTSQHEDDTNLESLPRRQLQIPYQGYRQTQNDEVKEYV